MTSAINPNNIDGAYPVAGQDNNSQGFRDNFTNTATNFQYAADEITDLQNTAELKSALTGTTLNNNRGGSVLSNAQLQDMSEKDVAKEIKRLEKQMMEHARNLEFEQAAATRDQLGRLRALTFGAMSQDRA